MNKRYLNELAEAVLNLGDRKNTIDFLEGILTQKELSEISLRLQIVKRLKAGEPQRKIADQLGVGIATITRGSKELQLGRFKNV